MMDLVNNSPLAQQSAVLEADSLHSLQNRENSVPSTTGENSSMAAGEISPGQLTGAPGDLPADQAGLSAGRGTLRYQGTDYTVVHEVPSEQALSLSQGDPILELVCYPWRPLRGALQPHGSFCWGSTPSKHMVFRFRWRALVF